MSGAEPVEPDERPRVVDLMEALEASLAAARTTVERNDNRHVPDLQPGSNACACGAVYSDDTRARRWSAAMSTLSDTLARLRAEAADELLAPAPAPTVAELGVGWSIYEKVPADGDYWPRGGVVVHVVPNGAHDELTGEAMDRYVVVRADQGQLNWTSLRADQVAALDDGSRPNAHTLAGVCQVATKELSRRLERRRGGAPDYDRVLELFSLGARLMAVIARPAAVAP